LDVKHISLNYKNELEFLKDSYLKDNGGNLNFQSDDHLTILLVYHSVEKQLLSMGNEIIDYLTSNYELNFNSN